jgi:hypothetical protein
MSSIVATATSKTQIGRVFGHEKLATISPSDLESVFAEGAGELLGLWVATKTLRPAGASSRAYAGGRKMLREPRDPRCGCATCWYVVVDGEPYAPFMQKDKPVGGSRDKLAANFAVLVGILL